MGDAPVNVTCDQRAATLAPGAWQQVSAEEIRAGAIALQPVDYIACFVPYRRADASARAVPSPRSRAADASGREESYMAVTDPVIVPVSLTVPELRAVLAVLRENPSPSETSTVTTATYSLQHALALAEKGVRP